MRTSSPESRATAASIVGAGVAIGVAYGAVELLPLESRGVGHVWIGVIYALAALSAGALVEQGWPGAWRPYNLVRLAIVLTGALWVLLYFFHGAEEGPTNWWSRMVLAVFSVLFVAVWFVGAAVSAKLRSR